MLGLRIGKPKDVSFFNDPDFDEDIAEEYVDMPGLTPLGDKLVKVIAKEYTNEANLSLVKDLFSGDKENVTRYFSPVRAQYRRSNGGNVVRLLSVEGKDLQKLDRATLSANFEAIKTQLPQILAYLKEKRVVHRDIKPENLIWNPIEKRVKLIDIETMLPLPPGVQVLPPSSEFYGTEGYVPPSARDASGQVIFGFDTDAYAVEKTIEAIKRVTGGRRRHKKTRKHHRKIRKTRKHLH